MIRNTGVVGNPFWCWIDPCQGGRRVVNLASLVVGPDVWDVVGWLVRTKDDSCGVVSSWDYVLAADQRLWCCSTSADEGQ